MTGAVAHGKGERQRAPAQRPPRSKRLAAPDRERQILEAAVKYFAEVGFNGQTRELAQRVGITQPLLYRYFATKQELVERVFQEVLLSCVKPAWTELIVDRGRPLEARLVDFYLAYGRATHASEWIRIYFFSALMGSDLNARYIRAVEDVILRPICAELRHYCGRPDPAVEPISEAELEHVWIMHGGLFAYAVRKYIYRSRVADDFAAVVRRSVATLLEGTKAIGPG